jgi:hypothetical protein
MYKKMTTNLMAEDFDKTSYGITEIYIQDPDGYVLGFAERSVG